MLFSKLNCNATLIWKALAPIRKFGLILLFGLSAFANAAGAQEPTFASTYADIVDGDGNITLPEEFQTKWLFIGTWSIAESDVDGRGAAGLHNVHTQPDVVEYFLVNMSFPDGAVLIKELLTG